MSQTDIPVALFIGVKQSKIKKIFKQMRIFEKRIPIKNLDIYISDQIYAVKTKSLILDATNLEYNYKDLLISLEFGLKSIDRIFFVIKLENNNMCDKIQPFLRQFKSSSRFLTILVNCAESKIEYDLQEIRFHFKQLGIESAIFFYENYDLSQEILNITLSEKQYSFSLYNYLIRNIKEIDEQSMKRPLNSNHYNQEPIIKNRSQVNQGQNFQQFQNNSNQNEQYQVYYPKNSRELQLLGSQNQRNFHEDSNFNYQSREFQNNYSQQYNGIPTYQNQHRFHKPF